MEKVLLIGSSYSALTILKILKNLNFKIIVCGNNKSDPCHKLSDKSIFLDYSNLKNTELIDLKLFDYIVPSFNDSAYLFATKLAQKKKNPGFDSFKTANAIHKKNLYKKLLTQSEIPQLKYLVFNSLNPSLIKEFNSFPAILKPIDSHSGKGCKKISSKKELLNLIKTLSNKLYIIEEFFNGSLHSHSAFISQKKIVIDFFVDEFTTNYPFQVNCSNSPSNLKKTVKFKIREFIQNFVITHNLCDGLLHTQFLVKNNSFFIVESMRRGPGDLYNKLIEESHSFQYTLNYILPFVGKSYIFTKTKYDKFFGRLTLDRMTKGNIFSIEFLSSFKNTKLFPLKVVGDEFIEAPEDKIGIIFVEYRNKKEMIKITPKLNNFFRINIIDNEKKI